MIAERFTPLLGDHPTSSASRRSRSQIALFLGLLTATAALLLLSIRLSISSFGSSSQLTAPSSRTVEAQNGVVASDDARCSVIGRDVLEQGGHAVDAAVATALCEGVVNPMASGIGGGAFLLLRLANGSAIAYDMREVAPAAASENMYNENPTAKRIGPLSIGVPGEIAGLYLAWKNHGRLPWKSLFQPAIKLARYGFVVSLYLEMEMNKTSEAILKHEELRKLLSPNGKLVRAGETLRNLELASTLQSIAEQGPGILYGGSIGQKLIKDIQTVGGILTTQDLKEYTVQVRRPTVVEVMGYKILGMPPPSSGGATMALILNILSNYADLSSVPEELYTHRVVEAFKHGYAVRMNLADPAFVNVADVLKDMLSQELASTLQKAIRDNTTFPPEYYGSKWNQLDDHGTSHFAIVDPDRNAVAMTTTVNWPFGSMILSNTTGILLNNEMDDFSVPSDAAAAKANFVAPKKRPLSSMSPTIVLKDDQLAAVLGASGGAKIITGTVQVFLNHFVRGLDPSFAVSKPRVHHQLVPNQVDCEDWTLVTGELVEVQKSVRDALAAKGHKVVSANAYCVTQLILQHLAPTKLNNTAFGKLIGVSDYRKEGAPAGF